MRIEVLTPGTLVRSPQRKKLMKTYKRVFEGPPWYERWPLLEVKRVFLDLARQSAFGYVGYDGPDPIAFIMLVNRALRDPVMWNGLYIAEFGVAPEVQGRGIGTSLAKILAEQFRSEGPVLFRTINPVVPHIFSKFGTVECVGRAKDDEYGNRFYYKVIF